MSASSNAEIHEALQQMVPLKSPSPYGCSPCFYQSYWKIVGGDEVCTPILEFFNDGVLDHHINCTYIVLISKVKSPVKPSY